MILKVDPDKRGRLLFETRHDKGLFQVYVVTTPTGVAYHGYFDNELSVTALSGAMVVIGLQKKHLTGLPEGKVIDFAAAAAKLREEDR